MGLFNLFRQKSNEPAGQFDFKGDWEFTFKFKAFEGLQSRGGTYTSKDSNKASNGTVRVTIADELNDDPDPTNEQINAINYIIEHPVEIRDAMITALESEYSNYKEEYGYDEEDSEQYFPSIKNRDDYKKVFGVGSVYILSPARDGFAYVGLGCGCTWDEEHGLGFLMHKDRVVKIGPAEQAFVDWDAYKDNGTYEQHKDSVKFMDDSSLPKPKIYQPHPKYNKLKPLQADANKMYVNNLVERGYNQEFKELVESGKVDINKNEALNMTYLERAAQCNNEEIVAYLVSKKPATLKNAIHNAARHCNTSIIELLLANGVDINEPDYWKNTALSITNETIEWMTRDNDERLGRYQQFVQWLISKGAR